MRSMRKSIKKFITQLSLRQKVVISAAVISLVIVIIIVQSQTGLRYQFKREANNFLISFRVIMMDLRPLNTLPQTDEAYNALKQMKDSLERLRNLAETKDEKQMLAAYEDINKKLDDLYRDAEKPELDWNGVIIRIKYLRLYDESFDLF